MWATPGPKSEPLETKFWRKVNKTDGCWLWTGTKNAWGYGTIGIRVLAVDGKPAWRIVRAHRVAYEMTVGPIPAGAHLLHSCDTPACVRPEHLRPGTMQENIADMIERGRMPRGSQRGHAKLTESAVRQLRDEYAADPALSCRALGERYGISMQTAYDVAAGRTWTHVGGPITRRKATLPTPRRVTEEGARTILRRYLTGERGLDLAREFNVYPSTVWKIIEGRTWRRLTADPRIRKTIAQRSHDRPHPPRTVTPEIVSAVLSRYQFRRITAEMLAGELGLHAATIRNILRKHGRHRPRRPHAANSMPRISFVTDTSALIPDE